MIYRALPVLLSLWMLAACAATSRGPQVPDAPVQNTLWKLQRLGGSTAPAPAAAARPAQFILHLDDNRSSGSGGCNRFTGSYTLEGNSLRFGPQAATRMACIDAMEHEQQFFDMLRRSAGWRIKGDHLWLLDTAGNTLAEFDALYLR